MYHEQNFGAQKQQKGNNELAITNNRQNLGIASPKMGNKVHRSFYQLVKRGSENRKTAAVKQFGEERREIGGSKDVGDGGVVENLCVVLYHPGLRPPLDEGNH